jgi:predicted nucleic acid-binding Zn ribbon protein
MTGPDRQGPTPLSDILGALFAARGYGRLRAAGELEAAWADAVGEPACRQTRVGGVRHGVLSVTVAHPALLEELAAFRKPALLAALREHAPAAAIHDIRFRVGPIEAPRPAEDARPTDPLSGPRPRRERRRGR